MGRNLQVDSDRLLTDFNNLSEIGATEAGGVHRPSLGVDHLKARTWLRERIQEADLRLQVDAAGNHSAILRCGPEGARTLLLGSHLDSVPNGGRFDGSLGVLAALECLQVVKEAGLKLPFHLEAIDFTDEEGTLVGLLGSSLLAGTLSKDELLTPRGGFRQMQEGLARAGLDEANLLHAKRDPDLLAGYLELHIEQGPRLFNQGVQIGVVTSIVGIASYRLTFIGRANHAGTTPMDARQDAGLGASAFSVAANQLVMEQFPGAVMNIGAAAYSPGAFNIIPDRAALDLEYRAADKTTLDRLGNTILTCAQEQAAHHGLTLSVDPLGKHDPTPMNPSVRKAIQQAAVEQGLSCIEMPSGAGHDALNMAALCPSGMIFVPSVDGTSHSPQEYSIWQDCINGANVLLNAILNFENDTV